MPVPNDEILLAACRKAAEDPLNQTRPYFSGSAVKLHLQCWGAAVMYPLLGVLVQDGLLIALSEEDALSKYHTYARLFTLPKEG